MTVKSLESIREVCKLNQHSLIVFLVLGSLNKPFMFSRFENWFKLSESFSRLSNEFVEISC